MSLIHYVYWEIREPLSVVRDFYLLRHATVNKMQETPVITNIVTLKNIFKKS